MGEEGEGVIILSKHNIRPSHRENQGGGGGGAKNGRTIHLNAFDLTMICLSYIQKGILFQNPTAQPMQVIISSLLSSFTAAIDHFFPLAGRLRATAAHDDDNTSSSLSISLECNSQGAEFVHAAALSVTVSDLLAPYLIPTIVHSFFPLNGLLNHEGLDKPLLAAQVTELADGLFVAISLNHVVADGTTFWHFFNTWSEICRSGTTNGRVDVSPPRLVDFDRWFPDSCPPPYRLPFRQVQDLVRPVQLPSVQECFLHFSAESVAKLKSRANTEMGTNRISSLQSLLAHVWRSVTRARGLRPEQETTYSVLVSHRARLGLPQTYMGNSIVRAGAKSSAGEVVGEGLGRTAWRLNQAIALHTTQASAHEWFESWTRDPSIPYLDRYMSTNLITGSSPRFDVYGNDFGWGKSVAVRSGLGAKIDGKVTVYPGPESGSMALGVCLSPKALASLLEDEEFMAAVNN
ncbi:putative uncharacterized acetyltransferase [Iris pallida]|uniref:Uncharacterized acetyltransferase n=1 Tax=Iris pallida TaxID=29817 RepID=A0AAX6I0C0_IRIPA|nr:putative uncharacterized acetyltransferase [Iris pallida]